MTETQQPSSYTLRLQAAETGAQPAVRAEFQFAPEKPAVGQPGAAAGDLLVQPGENGTHRVIVSLGKAEKCSPEKARRAGGALGNWLIDSGAKALGIDLNHLPECDGQALAQAILEGLKLGAYRFERYKKRAEQPEPITVSLLGGAGQAENQALAERVEAVTNAVILARDISHEPANVINPLSLAERARQVADQWGLKITVLDEHQLQELGAGAILAVGQGSQTPPRLIILEYAGQGTVDEHAYRAGGQSHHL